MSFPARVLHKHVSTFNPARYIPNDFVVAKIFDDFRLGIRTPGGLLSKDCPIDFSNVNLKFRLDTGHIRGFFHYHMAYPRHFLSGSIRFRCTRTSQQEAFLLKNGGVDLMGRHDNPWDISLARMLTTKRYEPLIDRLELDGFLSEEKTRAARRLLHKYNPIADSLSRGGYAVQHVHEIGQPFVMDLSQPTRICVTAPHSLIPVDLYPSVAKIGVITVRFERASKDPDDESLVLRVIHQHTRIEYLSEYSHLQMVKLGGVRLLYLPQLDARKDVAPLRWVYDDHHPAQSAALHCLFHPPCHFPMDPQTLDAPPSLPVVT